MYSCIAVDNGAVNASETPAYLLSNRIDIFPKFSIAIGDGTISSASQNTNRAIANGILMVPEFSPGYRLKHRQHCKLRFKKQCKPTAVFATTM